MTRRYSFGWVFTSIVVIILVAAYNVPWYASMGLAFLSACDFTYETRR